MPPTNISSCPRYRGLRAHQQRCSTRQRSTQPIAAAPATVETKIRTRVGERLDDKSLPTLKIVIYVLLDQQLDHDGEIVSLAHRFCLHGREKRGRSKRHHRDNHCHCREDQLGTHEFMTSAVDKARSSPRQTREDRAASPVDRAAKPSGVARMELNRRQI